MLPLVLELARALALLHGWEACIPPSPCHSATLSARPAQLLPFPTTRLAAVPTQDVAREAALAAGGGEPGPKDWLLDTVDAADAAAMGDAVSAAVAGPAGLDASAGGDGVAAPGTSSIAGGNGSGDGSAAAGDAALNVCVPLLVGNPGALPGC